VLDDVFAAHVRNARILARAPARSALAQEIPIPIELHGDRVKARAVLVGQVSILAVFEQPVLFVNQTFDVFAYLGVVHP
jgi:hypothetical protein